MAGLNLLDGTTASATISTGIRSAYGGSPATAVPWTGVAGYFSCDIMREMFEQTVFSSGGWKGRVPGMRQLVGRIDGFASKGLSISDPMALFGNNFAIQVVATFETLCTLTFDAFATRHHSGMRAAGNSEMGVDFESSGAVTSAWVTT